MEKKEKENHKIFSSTQLFFFFNKWVLGSLFLWHVHIALFIWLALYLCCCMWAFSSCREWEILSSCGAWASHCDGFSCCGFRTLEHRFSSSGIWVQLLCGLWNLSISGIEPLSPVLTGRFLTSEQPGGSSNTFLNKILFEQWMLLADLGLAGLGLWRKNKQMLSQQIRGNKGCDTEEKILQVPCERY